MKKRKFYISLILIILGMMFWQCKESKAETCEVNGVTYVYDIINGNAENVYIQNETEKYSGDLAIPNTLDGHTVVSVGDGIHNVTGRNVEFSGNTLPGVPQYADNNKYMYSIDNLRLPSSLRKINPMAFYGIGFKSAYTIPEGVELIGDMAFANVNIDVYPSKITIPNSVQEIGDYAFANSGARWSNGEPNYDDGVRWWWNAAPNGVSELQLGTGITKIGNHAFLGQKYLSNLTIPLNVTEIGDGAFANTGITNVNIEGDSGNERAQNLKIGSYAFKSIPLKRFKVLKNYEMGSYVFSNSGLEEIEFCNGITSIPEGICYECLDLNNVIKTNTITEIKDKAFYGCVSLTTEEYNDIVANVTIIGNYAFARCTGLTGNVEVKNIVTSLGTWVFSECQSIDKVEIKASIAEIPEGTFYKCIALKEVVKPSTIKTIGKMAFSECESLTTEKYDNIVTNVTVIGDKAFEKCIGLTGNVEIKNIVTSLGKYVFSNCSNIETVNVNANITGLPEGTFNYCTSLTDATLSNTITLINDKVFYNCTNLTMEAYNKIATNITGFGQKAFYNCTGLLGDLTIKNNVTYISKSCFENCTGVTNILFEPASQENSKRINIAEKVFYNTAKDQEIVRISRPSMSIDSKAFTKIREAYMYCSDGNTSKAYDWNGATDVKPIVHYLDCKHNIDITCTLPGVTLVNPETNEVLNTQDVNCEDDFTFKLVIQEEYKEKYEDLSIKVVSEGKYSNSDVVEEYITLDENNTYTLNSVNRNKKIIVQSKREGTDLVLRQYISEKNGIALVEKRKVSEKIENKKLPIINYNHTKVPVNAKKSDKLTYVVRAYNEGAVAGQVDEITVRLGDKLKLAEDSINELYGWTVSDDGKTIKTTYLADKPVESYVKGSKPNYQEVEYVLEVTDNSDEDQYIATLAEISKGNDIDSLEGSISNIDLTDYMKDECYTSSVDTYTRCVEDDTDIEAILIGGKPQVEYNLVVNKIDSLSNELLNGAKIQLLNENKEVIKTAVTENGTINFGQIISYGEGKDVYYLNEVETPAGYLRTMEGMIELQVIKTLNDDGDLDVEIVVDIQNKEDVTNNATIEEDVEYTPIYTEEQLQKIGSNENVEVNGKTYAFNEQANYQLQNDIEMTSAFNPINHMDGIFDGNGHTISNLTIENQNTLEVGLFRTFSGTIKNLNITEADITGAGSTDGKETVYNQPATGTLVGYMEDGVIKNVNITSNIGSTLQNVGGFVGHTHENGTVIFEDCTYTNSGTLNGQYNIGGFVGCAKSQIIMKNCVETQSVSIPASYNVGGLIGVSENNLTIEGCVVNGAISTSAGVNVGGLVGYTAEGSTIIINSSTNKASGVMGKQNIGGIVGYNESVINILECNNEATVQSNNGINAGGIIGYSKVTGDAPANAIVGFDSDTKTIKLNIRNKQTTGTYKVNINKVDLSLEEENQGLSGAKFNIYDKDKNLIKENCPVDENGYLTLDNIVINSLVTDVYFIKEVEAPAGYDILIKDYIKIEVTKTWDGVNEKYIIDTNSKVVTEPDETETENDDTKTGETAEKLTYTNVRYKINKTAIQNCTNIGNVISPLNSGGMAGSIRGYCLIDGCNNGSDDVVKQIVAHGPNGIVGGIVGDVAVNAKDDEATISNCKNKSVIYGGHAGGIVGITGSSIEIKECENTAEIKITGGSAPAVGGIVGEVCKSAIIDSCVNRGKIQGNHAGGIVGTAIGATNDYAKNVVGFNINCEYLEIKNCTTSDYEIQVTGSGNAAGIIAGMYAEECIINNNTVENVTIKGNSSGGVNSLAGIIAATGKTRYIEVESCNVINSNINSATSVAGVIGAIGADGYTYDGSSSDGADDREIRINNCNIYGGYLTGGTQGAAGIIHTSMPRTNTSIIISNSGVHEDENGNECNISSNWNVSGIATGGSFGQELKLYIDGCIVENISLIGSSNGDCNIAGIAGYFDNTKENNVISVKNSIVRNCNMYETDGRESNCNITGIINGAGGYDGQINTLLVEGCTAENINISHQGKAIIAGVLSQVRIASKEVQIIDCNVRNLSVEARYSNANGPDYVFGGILSYFTSSNVTIDNCSVQGLDVQNARGNAGGMVGFIESAVNLEITNSECVSYLDEETNTVTPNTFVFGGNLTYYTCGGVIANTNNNYRGTVNVNNVTCSDIVIENKLEPASDSYNNSSAGNKHIGGFAGILGSATISDVEMSNIQIDNDYATSAAGFIGTTGGNSGNLEITNVNASNIEITESFGTASAFITRFDGGAVIDNVELSDYNITIDTPRRFNDQQGYFVGGLISKITGGSVDISNVKMNDGNVEIINADGLFAGNRYNDGGTISGLVAMNNGMADISDVEVNGLTASVTFENAERNNEIEAIHMSGIMGTGYSNGEIVIDNATVSNLNFNNETKDGVIGGIQAVHVGAIDRDGNESYFGDVKITNSTVTNMIANGNYAIGGIIGCGKPIIENCTVKNPLLTGTSKAATVGSAIGIASAGSEVTNITVTADLPEGLAEPDTYGVFSEYLAGGIAAINSGSLRDSKVENIIVKTFMKLIEENSDNTEQTEDEPASVENATNVPCADEVQVKYYERWINCIIDNVKLIQEKVSL